MCHYAKNVLTKLIMMMIFMIILGDDDATAADDDNCRWGTVNFYIIIIFILLSLFINVYQCLSMFIIIVDGAASTFLQLLSPASSPPLSPMLS